MVEIMKEEWRGLLVQDLSQQELTKLETQQLPSPADLRNKILVKVKYTPPEVAKKKQAQSTSRNAASDSSDDEAGEEKVKKSKISPALSQLGIYMRSYHFKSFDQPGRL